MEQFEAIVEGADAGLRLDVYLSEQIEDISRSFVKRMVKDGLVEVAGRTCTRPSRLLNAGEQVTAAIPPAPTTSLTPEAIPLDILHEDEDVLVVDKPSGLVMHPAPGHYSGTLVNAVLHHCGDLSALGCDPDRPGIVHRLDRCTSGIVVVAKSRPAFLHLSQQAREHTFDRRYIALVRGEFPEDTGRIVAAVGRSLVDPKRMSVTGIRGRDAATRFRVLERFGAASLVELELETGRTHQIRVHLRFAGRPVLGDPIYGTARFEDWPVPPAVRTRLEALDGQALHARLLGFTHPRTGERLTFTSDPPEDFAAALDALRSLITPIPDGERQVRG